MGASMIENDTSADTSLPAAVVAWVERSGHAPAQTVAIVDPTVLAAVARIVRGPSAGAVPRPCPLRRSMSDEI
jgi:hypothetical protein